MRCAFCNKKIGIIEYDCRCEKKFCTRCRLPEQHKCSFDHKLFEKQKLNKKMVKVDNEKIIKIETLK